MIREAEETVQRIIVCANELAEEPFDMATPLTQLSGGQSRALMIADTAFLSPLPVVVIDELKNAGIDRRKALDLLVREEKIVIMSTHDPILALMVDRRMKEIKSDWPEMRKRHMGPNTYGRFSYDP